MVSIKNLGFSYKKNGEALFSDLDLQLKGGMVCGLLGMNGAGKSTLLKLLCGTLFSQEGEIQLLGMDPQKRNPEMLQDIFYLPEDYVLPSVSGWEYLKIYSPFFQKFDHQKMDELCKELEVDRDKKLHRLSHGQKKKFLLAFGIASNSSLMVLDEPTNGLDIPSKTLFRKLIAAAISEERLILISTHQVKDVETLIDPVVILHQGKVLFNHDMSEITDNLDFQRLSQVPDGSEVYQEAIPGGYGAIFRGAGQGHVDLELLFNSVIHKGDILGGSNE